MFYDWHIIGHEKELAFIEKHLRTGRIGHAYLFVGPRNIGKFTVAKTFVKILQCPNQFCRTCPVCVQVEKSGHLDTIEIPDDGTSIKIEPIRDIIARLNMTPQSQYKILLIKNIGRITEEAGNSLLKLIEEPTAKTIFLFTAESAREVLPTMLSRMYRIKFKPVQEDLLRNFLKKQYAYLGEGMLDRIMMLSFGAPGMAISLIENEGRLRVSSELYERTKRFIEEKTLTERFAHIQELAVNPEIVREFLMMLLNILRNRALKTGDGPAMAGRMEIVRLIEKIPEVTGLLLKNVNARLTLENLALEFSSL